MITIQERVSGKMFKDLGIEASHKNKPTHKLLLGCRKDKIVAYEKSGLHVLNCNDCIEKATICCYGELLAHIKYGKVKNQVYYNLRPDYKN